MRLQCFPSQQPGGNRYLGSVSMQAQVRPFPRFSSAFRYKLVLYSGIPGKRPKSRLRTAPAVSRFVQETSPLQMWCSWGGVCARNQRTETLLCLELSRVSAFERLSG